MTLDQNMLLARDFWHPICADWLPRHAATLGVPASSGAFGRSPPGHEGKA
jgi:hypothetical protein